MRHPILSPRFTISAIFLFISAKLAGEPTSRPSWWYQGNPPAVAATGDKNNLGPANIGQAKYMASEALRVLQAQDPTLANAIREKLTVPQANPGGGSYPAIVDFTIPVPKTSDWIEKQKSALSIGQLKAIATPFYNEINKTQSIWMLGQILRNHNGMAVPNETYWQAGSGTSFTNGGFYPWNPSTNGTNASLATIGQLKAVFSLEINDLRVDADGDGVSDVDEIANGTDPYDGDQDGDGMTYSQEIAAGTSPTDADTDGDGFLDGTDSAPLVPDTVPQSTTSLLMVWTPLE